MPDRSSLLSGFRLEEWLVKPDDGSVTSATSTARLEPQLMELLVFLCSRPHQVVSKQQILDAVWSGRFVSDETLKGGFYQLRKVLGDDSKQPRFIETLPKRGYRMLAQPTLLDSSATVPDESDVDALCRKGRAALTTAATTTTLTQARIYFERAIALAADHPAALAGLARTFLLIIDTGAGDPRETLAQVKAVALRLHGLDGRSADASLGVAVVAFLHEYDAVAADRAFQRATSHAPHDSLAHKWYARFLSTQQRHDEAIAEARRAVACDPLALAVRRTLLDAMFFARRYDDMLAEARQIFEIAPASPEIQLGLVWVHCLLHDEARAFDAFIAGLTALGVAPVVLEAARDTFGQSGMTGIFKLWLDHLNREAALGHATTLDRLALNVLMGDVDRCFALIDSTMAGGHSYVGWIVTVSPLFDALRGDARYRALVARLTQPFPNQ